MTKTIFFEALQNEEALDLRDNRGREHFMCIILLEFVITLLCHRDGNLSSIHRHMNSHHTKIVRELGTENTASKKQYQSLIYQYYWVKSMEMFLPN